MKINISIALLMICSATFADIFGNESNEISIEFVGIGSPNSNSDNTGYGAIDYNYRIGKFEVTVDQFSKARSYDNRISDGDENLWNNGAQTVGANAPASFVSWYEAAKFCNWLTTGDAYSGVYQFDLAGTYTGLDREFRNGDSIAYVLPTKDEWYKAAYYKDGSYSDYANGSNTTPLKGAGGWNYDRALTEFMWETGSSPEEQNGTHDMMGNVYEWTEHGNSSDNRGIKGGGAFHDETYLHSSKDFHTGPVAEYSDVGFRIVAIPEPSTFSLIGLSGFGLFLIRKKLKI